MADVNLVLDPQLAGKSKEELSQILDQEVERFSNWMEQCPDIRAQGALTKPERALMKTYLVQKITGKL